jgi:hypothetical protein
VRQPNPNNNSNTDTKVHPETKDSADSTAAPVGFIE